MATTESTGELHTTISGLPLEPIYTPETTPDRLRARPGAARRVPVHARRPPDDVPRPAVDDAAVRGLRHGRGDERALQVPARARADGPVHRLRFAHAHGLRLRPPALARRGRRERRRDRLARRHGDALRRHPARRGLDVDDDQRPGGDPARVLHLRRARSRASRATSCAARCRTTSSRSSSRRTSGIFPPEPVDADRRRT